MVSLETIYRLYRLMVLTRLAEERHDTLFKEKKIPLFAHVSLGQEAVGVGVSGLLRKDDYLFGTHRGMPEYLAKGMTLKNIFAEYGARANSLSKGRGGIHLCDAGNGVLGLVGCLGSDFGFAVGVGFSIRNRGTDQVVVKYFGEGTAEQADFHPSMNMMSLWKLPVIFICVNNQYTQLHHYRGTASTEHIAPRAEGYGVPWVIVEDGNNLVAVCEAMEEAINRARSGKGPTLIEYKTYRIGPHYSGDPYQYREEEGFEIWKKRDPIQKCREFLIKKKVLTKEKDQEIQVECDAEIEEAIRWMNESPFPNPEEALVGVYA